MRKRHEGSLERVCCSWAWIKRLLEAATLLGYPSSLLKELIAHEASVKAAAAEPRAVCC
jgi:hypothetical protein